MKYFVSKDLENWYIFEGTNPQQVGKNALNELKCFQVYIRKNEDDETTWTSIIEEIKTYTQKMEVSYEV